MKQHRISQNMGIQYLNFIRMQNIEANLQINNKI